MEVVYIGYLVRVLQPLLMKFLSFTACLVTHLTFGFYDPPTPSRRAIGHYALCHREARGIAGLFRGRL